MRSSLLYQLERRILGKRAEINYRSPKDHHTPDLARGR